MDSCSGGIITLHDGKYLFHGDESLRVWRNEKQLCPDRIEEKHERMWNGEMVCCPMEGLRQTFGKIFNGSTKWVLW